MEKENRVSKHEYYLDIAETVLERSTCLRRKYGAVIVKNDEVISTGYNGSARGDINCIDAGKCEREEHNIPKGQRYEMCKAVHAEQNAIISASRRDMIDATLYIVGKEVATGEYANGHPCLICERMIRNAGISKIVMRKDKNTKIIIDNVGDPIETYSTEVNSIEYGEC